MTTASPTGSTGWSANGRGGLCSGCRGDGRLAAGDGRGSGGGATAGTAAGTSCASKGDDSGVASHCGHVHHSLPKRRTCSSNDTPRASHHGRRLRPILGCVNTHFAPVLPRECDGCKARRESKGYPFPTAHILAATRRDGPIRTHLLVANCIRNWTRRGREIRVNTPWLAFYTGAHQALFKGHAIFAHPDLHRQVVARRCDPNGN